LLSAYLTHKIQLHFPKEQNDPVIHTPSTSTTFIFLHSNNIIVFLLQLLYFLSLGNALFLSNPRAKFIFVSFKGENCGTWDTLLQEKKQDKKRAV